MANENDRAPLAATLEIAANEPVTARLELVSGDERVTRAFDPVTSQHALPVLGLRAGRRYELVATVSDAAGNEASTDPFSLTAVDVPDGFPTFEVTKRDPERMEPGFTMFTLTRWPEAGSDSEFGALVMVNDAGDVVWYYVPGHNIEDARMLGSGNILFNQGRSRGRATEIDLFGNVVRSWHAARAPGDPDPASRPVDTDSFHHELAETSNGNFVVVSSAVRTLDAYPTSSVDRKAPRARAHVVDDVVVEFTADGTVTRRHSLMDVLDPVRVSHSSFGGGFWSAIYPDELKEGLHDWAHTNGVFYDERSSAFIASVRHQDAVVKIDASSGELVWILGTHANWHEPWHRYLLSPVGEVEWPYHQHSPEVTPNGTILIFDNGTHRGAAFEDKMPTEDSYSRAVEYAVDEETMEVRQVWSYGGRPNERFYSSFLSDVDLLPRTGNVLMTDGGKISDAEWRPTDRPGVYRWARIVELTHTAPAEIVFELRVTGEPPMGWHVYRAERIAGLYGE